MGEATGTSRPGQIRGSHFEQENVRLVLQNLVRVCDLALDMAVGFLDLACYGILVAFASMLHLDGSIYGAPFCAVRRLPVSF